MGILPLPSGDKIKDHFKTIEQGPYFPTWIGIRLIYVYLIVTPTYWIGFFLFDNALLGLMLVGAQIKAIVYPSN